MSSTYYDILEVDSTATYAQIKKAYRKLVLKFHPDKNNGNVQYENIIKQLNEAYATLSDPERRKLYDRQFLDDDYPFEHVSTAENEYATAADEEEPFSFSSFFYDHPWFVVAMVGLLLRLLIR